MKQKMVLKVQMTCEKCRSKAMKIAVKVAGVTKVEIQGKEKDHLVVIGDEVDSVNLTRKLRKKLHYASIVSVEEEKEKEEKKDEGKKILTDWPAYYHCRPQELTICEPTPSSCSIM